MLSNLAMLVVGAVVYGATFPVNRVAVDAAWPPVAFAFFQTFTGGVVLAAMVRWRGHQLVPSLQHVRSYVVIGALAMALPAALIALTAEHVPTVLLTLVMALSPVLTLTFATALRLEPFRPRVAAAMALAFAGVVLIASPWSHAMTATQASWFLLALLIPALFAASNVAASVLRPPDTASATMAAGILIGGGLVVLPLALLVGPSLTPPAATPGALWSLLAASGINAFVVVLFFELIRRAGPTFFSMFNYIALPAGVMWSIALFGELPPPIFWLALILMLGGVAAALGGKPAAT